MQQRYPRNIGRLHREVFNTNAPDDRFLKRFSTPTSLAGPTTTFVMCEKDTTIECKISSTDLGSPFDRVETYNHDSKSLPSWSDHSSHKELVESRENAAPLVDKQAWRKEREATFVLVKVVQWSETESKDENWSSHKRRVHYCRVLEAGRSVSRPLRVMRKADTTLIKTWWSHTLSIAASGKFWNSDLTSLPKSHLTMMMIALQDK